MYPDEAQQPAQPTHSSRPGKLRALITAIVFGAFTVFVALAGLAGVFTAGQRWEGATFLTVAGMTGVVCGVASWIAHRRIRGQPAEVSNPGVRRFMGVGFCLFGALLGVFGAMNGAPSMWMLTGIAGACLVAVLVFE